MKIEKKKLSAFLKKVHMNEIDECLFEFSETGLKITSTTPAKMSFVDAILLKEAFTDYEIFGAIALNDLRNLMNAIDHFGKEVELKKEGNILTIKEEGKSLDVELMAKQFLEDAQKVPNIVPDETFTITAKQLSGIFKDVLMNKDSELIIETKPGAVRFRNTGKYKFTNDFLIEGVTKEIKVKFGMPLIDALNNLTDNIEFGVKTDYPAIIKEKTTESVITIIVAPRVGQDE
jgi:hypothetical protein